MVSASWLLRKSSNRSACEPRAPRWTSEINKVRKRRSGLSSREESLPIPVHLTDCCDRAMTSGAADSPREPTTRIDDAPLASRITARYDNPATWTTELQIDRHCEPVARNDVDGVATAHPSSNVGGTIRLQYLEHG